MAVPEVLDPGNTWPERTPFKSAFEVPASLPLACSIIAVVAIPQNAPLLP